LTRRRQVTAARGHREGDTVLTFRTRQAALVQTDRATRYGPNFVTSICCGFGVQLAVGQIHNNQQRIHNRSTANRMPTTNRQHLKPHSTNRTSCKLVGNPSCQLVGKLVVSGGLVGNYTVSQKKTMTPKCCSQLPQMLTDFQNSLTGRLTSKFATNFV